jgi:uncharacterized protein (TIGR02268 family)
MIPPSPSSMLVFFILQGTPLSQLPPDGLCEDVRRIELSLDPTAANREVCVSPGLVTSFLFDTPAGVDLQDEVRFLQVMRGRSSIGLVPPRDMAPGEHLRLTLRFGDGASQESVTFVLVAHSGQATRQVEVYRDQRSRESYQQELAQERVKARQMLLELQELRSELTRAHGLRGVISSAAVGLKGIQVQQFPPKPTNYAGSGLTVVAGASYRSDTTVAVQLTLGNSGEEPWTMEEATLTSNGEPLKGLIWVAETIPPNDSRPVVVEVDTQHQGFRGNATLTLRGKDARVINISDIMFPEAPPSSR